MCLECDGMSREQVLELVVRDIEEHGWAVVAVDGDGWDPPLAYTVGLTRFHGHPELMVSGLGADESVAVLDRLGEEVRRGRRFEAGDVLPQTSEMHACLMVRVSSPMRLVMAQQVYGSNDSGPVPALQVAWADCSGTWPWQSPDGLRAQRLYGRPKPRAA